MNGSLTRTISSDRLIMAERSSALTSFSFRFGRVLEPYDVPLDTMIRVVEDRDGFERLELKRSDLGG